MTQQAGTGQLTVLRWLYAIAQSSSLLGLAMIGLIWLSIAFHVEIERDNTEHAAVENSQNLARAFDAHLSQSLTDVDRTMQMLRSYYGRDPQHFDINLWNAGTHVLDRDVMQFSIVGADGHLRASTNPTWTPVYVGDREHFRALAGAADDRLYISKPVIGRISHRRTIQLARRIERDGKFFGILTASLDPAYFARLYDSIEVGAEGYIRVVGTDGVIRAEGGGSRGDPGTDLSSSHLFEVLPSQPSGWHYSKSAHTDHVSRLVVYRSVKDFPLIITLGRSTKEIFAAVNAKRKSYNLIAGLLTILILGAVGHSVSGRLQLDRANDELKAQNARFQAALNNMPHGMSMYDAESRFLVSNRRYHEIYGIPPELAKVGTPLTRLLAQRIALEGSDEDPEAA